LARVPGENVEIVKRAFEAFGESGVDGILAFIHEDFEGTTPPTLASEPDTYVGHDGVRRYFDSFSEVMDDIRWEAHGFHEVGDKVVVEFTVYARGKSTGLEFGQSAVQVWTLRDGKATRLELFPTLEEALEAAGGGQA
jgi:ketosteroid isomerase-like protein